MIPKITRKLADNCAESDDNFDSLLAVHKDFEKWLNLILCHDGHDSNYFISSILEKFFTEVRYHPLLEDFPEYTSLRREPVSYDPTEKFSFGQTLTSGTRCSGYYSLYLYLLQRMTPVLSPALR